MSSLRAACLCSALAFAFACGDTGSDPKGTGEPAPPPGEDDAIPMTVLVPVTADSLEYRIHCNSEPDPDAPFEQATVEARGAVVQNPDRPSDVWRASVSLEPGECVVTLVVREGDEVICVGSDAFNATDETSAVYFDMPYCRFACSIIEFPETDDARKTICLPGAALLLSASTPLDLPVAEVRYTLRLKQIDIVEGPGEASGMLERYWVGTADFGEGSVPTYTWQSTIGRVDWVYFDLELTAVDDEGATLCESATAIELTWDIANSVHVVMPCSP